MTIGFARREETTDKGQEGELKPCLPDGEAYGGECWSAVVEVVDRRMEGQPWSDQYDPREEGDTDDAQTEPAEVGSIEGRSVEGKKGNEREGPEPEEGAKEPRGCIEAEGFTVAAHLEREA